MDRKPLVSVIMSVYNEPEYMLSEAVNSILKQTFRDFEFIIVNDNPKTSMLNSIKKACGNDDRVRILNNEENLGLARSLNKGIEVAVGKYMARMDADDISREDRLAVEVEYLERTPDI